MLMVVVLMTGVAMAQNMQQEKTVEVLTGKELRKQKRIEQKAIFEAQKKAGIALIEGRDFVLQAERLGGKNSVPLQVSNQINFIKIEGDELVVQLGSPFIASGNNGLGGTTYRGKISKIESTNLGKGKPYLTSILFSSSFLPNVTTINLRISGNQARAAVWNSGRVVNFEGFYHSNEKSFINESEILGTF